MVQDHSLPQQPGAAPAQPAIHKPLSPDQERLLQTLPLLSREQKLQLLSFLRALLPTD